VALDAWRHLKGEGHPNVNRLPPIAAAKQMMERSVTPFQFFYSSTCGSLDNSLA
jgi:hypothetical protein